MANSTNLGGSFTIGSGLGNISLGNLSLQDDGLDFLLNSSVRKYQMFEIDEDLLALSTAWKRLRDDHKAGGEYPGITRLLDKSLFSKVTDEDRNQANVIRDHYSKQIMLLKLKGQNLSKFKEDMNTFIHTDGKLFKEEMCPLVYRLPEFYEYDSNFEKLANEHNKLVAERPLSKVPKKLTLQKTFIIGKRYSKRKEYWFTDEADNLVSLTILKDNPLVSLLDLHAKTPIMLTAKYDIRSRGNIQYMIADKYSFS